MQTRIYVTKTKKKEKSCVVIFFKQTPTHRERERERDTQSIEYERFCYYLSTDDTHDQPFGYI